MQLIKASALEGEWFTYTEDGEFRIRRIPAAKEKEAYFRHFGKKLEVRRKDGAAISSTDIVGANAYNVELASFALLDSRNAEVPASLLEGTALARETLASEDMIKLDGGWTDEVKIRVLGELPQLAIWVLSKANGMTATAAEEAGKADGA